MDLNMIGTMTDTFYIKVSAHIQLEAMKKEMIPGSLQRTGGWCEPAGVWIFPLLELSMKIEGLYPLAYLREAVHTSGNLGGNADSFRPMS